MNKDIQDKADLLLQIDEINTMYNILMSKPANKEKNIEPFMMLLNIIVRFVEGPEMKELEHEYDEMLKVVTTVNDELSNIEYLKQFTEHHNSLIDFINRVYDQALQLNDKGELLLSWKPGVGDREGVSVKNGN